MPLRPTRKAFSLIEAAIVLGIVGLVIGGIWIAAAELNFRHRQHVFNNGLLHIYTQAQNLIPRDFPCGTTWITTRADAMGIRPKDWPLTAAGSFGVPEYGDDLNLAIVCDADNKLMLHFQFYDFPYKYCRMAKTYIAAVFPASSIHTQAECYSWPSINIWKLYLFK